MRRGRFPLRATLLEIGLHVQASRFYVESNNVAIAQQRDRSAVRRFRSDVADHQPVRRTAETSIRDQCDTSVNSLTCERAGHRQHFAHPRPALRSLIAYDDHVSRLNLPA